jgi:hypothetical protein
MRGQDALRSILGNVDQQAQHEDTIAPVHLCTTNACRRVKQHAHHRVVAATSAPSPVDAAYHALCIRHSYLHPDQQPMHHLHHAWSMLCDVVYG